MFVFFGVKYLFTLTYVSGVDLTARYALERRTLVDVIKGGTRMPWAPNGKHFRGRYILEIISIYGIWPVAYLGEARF